MRYTPCTYAQRWPELWAHLSDDRARQSLSNALANGRLEGMEPTRELVEDQVARARGEMSRVPDEVAGPGTYGGTAWAARRRRLMPRYYEWEDYFWPNTTVLANKMGIVDEAELRDVEYDQVVDRQGEIERGEVHIARTFDGAHLRAVHAHLFQDVYEWAGQYRTVDMAKGGRAFLPYRHLDEWLNRSRQHRGAASITTSSPTRPPTCLPTSTTHTVSAKGTAGRRGSSCSSAPATTSSRWASR